MVEYRIYVSKTVNANQEATVEKFVPKSGETIKIKKFNFTSSGSGILEVWVENDKRYEIPSDFKEDINYGINVDLELRSGEECNFIFKDTSGASNTVTLVVVYDRTTA